MYRTPTLSPHVHMQKTCIHTGNVCDDIYDCPLGDDEMLFYLKRFKFLLNCHCLFPAIEASFLNIDIDYQPLYLPVFISDSDINFFQKVKFKLQNAIIVSLPRNCIQEICKCSSFIKILRLNLEFNCLKKIFKYCMASLSQLKSQNLNDNHIMFFETESFFNLLSLMFINVSSNPLLSFQHINHGTYLVPIFCQEVA